MVASYVKGYVNVLKWKYLISMICITLRVIAGVIIGGYVIQSRGYTSAVSWLIILVVAGFLVSARKIPILYSMVGIYSELSLLFENSRSDDSDVNMVMLEKLSLSEKNQEVLNVISRYYNETIKMALAINTGFYSILVPIPSILYNNIDTGLPIDSLRVFNILNICFTVVIVGVLIGLMVL